MKEIVGIIRNKKNILVIALFVIYSFFILFKLGGTIFNADEHFWFERSQKFTAAVIKRDFAKTYQNPKPGVTVMWLSGTSLELFFKIYEAKNNFRPEVYSFETFPIISFISKFPLVILNILGLIAFFLILKKRVSNDTLIFTLFFLCINPYFIGISRYFHGDGTLTIFMMLSSILIIAPEKITSKHALASGVLAGLATLTKLQGIYLLPFTMLIFFIEFLSKRMSFKNIVTYSALWMGATIITFFILYPALWINPIEVLQRTYREAFLITTEGMNTKALYNPYLKAIPMVFTFPTIILFMLGSLYSISKKHKILTYSLIFIFFYAIQIQIVEQKSERYLLPLFPFIAIVCAHGMNFLENKLSKQMYHLLLTFIVVINSAWLIWNTPYYTAHAERAPWGAVYVKAANYLNAKEDSVNFKVVAVEKPHTFRPFFKGKTYGVKETLPNGWSPEYIITSNRGDLPDKYSYCIFEENILFRGKIYWKIYACK